MGRVRILKINTESQVGLFNFKSNTDRNYKYKTHHENNWTRPGFTFFSCGNIVTIYQQKCTYLTCAVIIVDTFVVIPILIFNFTTVTFSPHKNVYFYISYYPEVGIKIIIF